MIRLAIFLSFAASAAAQLASEQTAIRNAVGVYVRSIDLADAEMGRKVWAEGAAVSFIHPLGHERGWEQVKRNFYEKLMRDLLDQRKLTVKDLVVRQVGGAALVEFYWDFHALFKKDGKPLRSSGRESQVWEKNRQGQWRIVHIHYSGMPATDVNRGL
jgi:ketosteroid isomerase-like protein